MCEGIIQMLTLHSARASTSQPTISSDDNGATLFNQSHEMSNYGSKDVLSFRNK